MKISHSLRTSLAVLAFSYSMSTGAVYNANMYGVVSHVTSYIDGDFIYFRLQNQPATNGQCDASYFVITEDVPQNRRNQAFAQLLASKLSGEPVQIGYDNSGDCAHGYIRVHRVG